MQHGVRIRHEGHVDVEFFIIVAFVIASVVTSAIEFIGNGKNELPVALPTLVVFQSVFLVECQPEVPHIDQPTEDLHTVITAGHRFDVFHGGLRAHTTQC